LAVAGGAGGSAYDPGGEGGGLEGEYNWGGEQTQSGACDDTDSCERGQFFYGGDGDVTTYGAGGGGGGWYGGGSNNDGGGGGSSWAKHSRIVSWSTTQGAGNKGDGEATLTVNSLENRVPQIDSKDVSPDPIEIGNSVSYSDSSSDPDGSISDNQLTVYKDGSQVYQNSVSSASNTWNDVYTPSSGGELDARFTATDDAGAETVEWVNRSLTDSAPSVSLSMDSKQFKYDAGYQFSVDASDSYPEEDLQCDVSRNGTLVEEVFLKEGTNSSFSGTARSDLGSHSLSVSCQDNAGNTGTDSASYEVKAYEIQSVYGADPVYETENRSFELDLKTGNMVNEADFKLNYDGSSEESKSLSSNGIETLRPDLHHEIPLVESNQTTKNWNIAFDINKTDFQSSSTSIISDSSSTRSQEVLHGYGFGAHNLENGFTQLEGSSLDYTATVNKFSSNANGELSGVTTFSQTGESKELSKDGLNYSETFNSDLVGKDKSFSLDTNFTLSFNDEERSFTSSKTVNLDNLVLSKTTGEKSIVFNSKDEVNTSSVDSNLEMGLKAFNPDQPGKTQFFGFDFDKSSTHEIFIQPSYAEVGVTAFQDNSLEYQNSDLDYPKRRYYLVDETLNNESIDTTLYMLKRSEGTDVQFELLDQDLNPLKQHLIRVERVFPSQNTTRTVSMLKTGSQGKGSTFIDTDEKYIFTVFDTDGELIQQIGPQTITSNPTTLEVEPDVEPSFAYLVNRVRFSDLAENNGSVSVSFVSETERLNNISLKVYEETLFNRKLLDSDSSSDVQGQLTVSNFNASEQKIFYEVEGVFGDDKINLRTGGFGTQTSDYGDTGLLMSLFMVVTITLTGVKLGPEHAIGLGVVSIFVAGFTGFLAISQSALISVTALGAVLIWRMSTRS